VHGNLAYTYTGNFLTWEYANGSWAQLQPAAPYGDLREHGVRSQINRWANSAATTGMLLRVAAHVSYGDSAAELFPFQLSGMPGNRGLYTTAYAGYEGEPVNTGLWLGVGPSTNGNDMQILVTPAATPARCTFFWGQSKRVTLDGTWFTLTTTPTPDNTPTPYVSTLEGWNEQELCGYTDHLQINIAVAQDLLVTEQWPLTSAQMQSYSAVSVFGHMTLLGPDPADWTTNPLG
jgi:hypothetical protein